MELYPVLAFAVETIAGEPQTDQTIGFEIEALVYSVDHDLG